MRPAARQWNSPDIEAASGCGLGKSRCSHARFCAASLCRKPQNLQTGGCGYAVEKLRTMVLLRSGSGRRKHHRRRLRAFLALALVKGGKRCGAARVARVIYALASRDPRQPICTALSRCNGCRTATDLKITTGSFGRRAKSAKARCFVSDCRSHDSDSELLATHGSNDLVDERKNSCMTGRVSHHPSDQTGRRLGAIFPPVC